MAFERVQQGPTGSHAREAGQQSLRAVLQSSFDAMVVVDRDGLVLFANPTAEQLLGRSAAELVGAQFGLPHTRGGAIEIEVGSAPRVAEMRVVEIEWEGRPALLALLRDVASLRLAAIVEQSADAIFAFDHEGVIIDWNRGAERLLGHAPADAIGRPAMMLVPENRSAEESERHRVALAGQSVDYETECVRADGTLVEVSMIVSPIRAASGEVIAASAIARDVTEQNALVQRLSEAQYYTRSLIETSVDPMITTDASGVITDVNQQMEALTAHTRAELIGTSFRDYVTEPGRADEGIERMLSDGSVRDFELTVRSQDGRETPVSYNATTFADREGTVQGVFAVARDITERKRAEEELEHLASVLERTEEISKTGGWEYDVATGELTWTDEVYRIYGVERASDPTEVTEAIAAYDHESAPIIDAAFKRLVAEGMPYDLELGLIRADGQRVWVHTIGRPVIDDGRVVRVGGNISDVTERKRIEEALRASDQLFHDGFDYSPTGMALTGLDGTLVEVNAAFARMLGFDDPSQLVGQDFARYTHPGDVAANREGIRMMVDEGKPYVAETRYIRKDGTVMYVLMGSTAVLDVDGRPSMLYTQVQDITERKQAEAALRASEERFRGGFANSPIGMALTGLDGRLVEVNATFARMLGFEDPAELTGQSFANIVHPDEVAQGPETIKRIIEQGSYHGERRYIHRDGTVVYALYGATLVRDADGRPSVLFGQVQDITERKLAEAEVLRLNAELERRVLQRTAELKAANRELEGFAYSLAHDLRAPIRAINGFGAALSQSHGEQLDDRGRETLDRVRRASARSGSSAATAARCGAKVGTARVPPSTSRSSHQQKPDHEFPEQHSPG